MRFLLEGYRRLVTHPRYGIWVVLATLVYLISPIDLSPDLIPLLGQIDDVALIVLLVSAAGQWFSQQWGGRQSVDSSGEPHGEMEDVRQTIDIEAIEIDASES